MKLLCTYVLKTAIVTNLCFQHENVGLNPIKSYESKCTYGSKGVGLTVIWLWNYYGKYYISKGVTMKMGMKIGCDLIALLKFLSEVYVARIGDK